jgi:hypothetical protein
MFLFLVFIKNITAVGVIFKCISTYHDQQLVNLILGFFLVSVCELGTFVSSFQSNVRKISNLHGCQ